MAVTLANLRDSVRIELRDPDGVTFQDSDVDYAVNQAYRKVFLMVSSELEDYFETVQLISLVANTRAYALPSYHLRTKMFEYVTGQVTMPLRRRKRGITSNFTGGISFNPAVEYPDFDFEGSTVVFEPTPLVSTTNAIRHTYYQYEANELTSDSSTLHADFKDVWKDGVVLEATRMCFSQLEALGGIVSTDIKDRIKEWKDVFNASVRLRTLSPQVRRRRGYFQ